jgi:hypothetical protein
VIEGPIHIVGGEMDFSSCVFGGAAAVAVTIAVARGLLCGKQQPQQRQQPQRRLVVDHGGGTGGGGSCCPNAASLAEEKASSPERLPVLVATWRFGATAVNG